MEKILLTDLLSNSRFVGIVSESEKKRILENKAPNNKARIIKKIQTMYKQVEYDSEVFEGKKRYFLLTDQPLKAKFTANKRGNKNDLDRLATKLFLEYLVELVNQDNDKPYYAKTKSNWLIEAKLLKPQFAKVKFFDFKKKIKSEEDLYSISVNEDKRAMFEKLKTGIKPITIEEIHIGLRNGNPVEMTEEEILGYHLFQKEAQKKLEKDKVSSHTSNRMKIEYDIQKTWIEYKICRDEIIEYAQTILNEIPKSIKNKTADEFQAIFKNYRDYRVIGQELQISSYEQILKDLQNIGYSAFSSFNTEELRKEINIANKNQIKAERKYFKLIVEKDKQNGYPSKLYENYYKTIRKNEKKQVEDLEVKNVLGNTVKSSESAYFEALRSSINDFF